MQEKSKGVDVRITTRHGTLVSEAGHKVRTRTERTVCEWLNARGIAHKHGSDVFIVKAGANRSPMLFVPDITITQNKTRDGRAIVIETLHSFSPKLGGLKTFAAFCRQFRKTYYSILISHKGNMETTPRGVYNALVDLGNLDVLTKRLNLNALRSEQNRI